MHLTLIFRNAATDLDPAGIKTAIDEKISLLMNALKMQTGANIILVGSDYEMNFRLDPGDAKNFIERFKDEFAEINKICKNDAPNSGDHILANKVETRRVNKKHTILTVDFFPAPNEPEN